MSKGSGGNRKSSSSKPAAMSGGANVNAMIKAGDATGVLKNILNDSSVMKRITDEYNKGRIKPKEAEVKKGELELGDLTLKSYKTPWGSVGIKAESAWATDHIDFSYKGSFVTKEQIVERIIDVIKEGQY